MRGALSTPVVTPKGDLRVDPLARRLAESLRRERWLQPEAAVLIGVSGGGDSVALLCLLHALAAENRWRLEAFHANHGLRGEEADRAETLVREMAEALGVSLSVRASSSVTVRRKVRTSVTPLGAVNVVSTALAWERLTPLPPVCSQNLGQTLLYLIVFFIEQFVYNRLMDIFSKGYDERQTRQPTI